MNLQKANGLGILATAAALICSCVLFCSCERFHFENPQPSDVPNEYVFPKEFRGQWKSEKKREEILFIGKNSIRMSVLDSMEVIDRMAELKDSLNTKQFLKYVNINKVTRKLDTITSYVIRGNKIYIKEHRRLSQGYPFTRKKDTLYFIVNHTLEFELNQKAFIRKISDNRYVLNIKEENLMVLDENFSSPWWQIILLELSTDHKLSFRNIDSKIINDPSLIFSDPGDFYFDVSWTKSELIKHADNGIFELSPEPMRRIGNP